MKQNILYIPTLLSIILLSSCAGIYLKNGRDAYDNLMYHDAIYNLEKGLHKKPNTPSKILLADAYMKVNEFDKAVVLYEEASIDPSVTDNQRMDFGRALMSNGQYDEAQNIFKGVLSRSTGNEVAQNLLSSCININALMNDSSLYDVNPINIPGVSTAFAPALYNGGLLFSGTESTGLNKDPYTGESFLDLYESKNENGNWKLATKIQNLDGKFHDGIASVSEDGSKMIITRSNYASKSTLSADDNYMSNTQLYISTKDAQGNWSVPQTLNFNDDKYMYAHPTLSADGNILFFSSNMAGGKGGMDIYQSSFDGNDWGAPVNLGAAINTNGDEVFPYLKSLDTLYYSSDGHTNMGGLDIMYAVKRNESWAAPEHIGYPFNSRGDDFGVAFNPESNSGFLSSDRSGKDKIYSFVVFSPIISIDGLITDINKLNPISGIRITVLNLSDGTQEDITSDSLGKFRVDLLSGKEYRLKTENDSYFSSSQDVSTIGITSNIENSVIFELEKLYIADNKDDSGDNQNSSSDQNDRENTQGLMDDVPDTPLTYTPPTYTVPNIHWDYNKWDIRPDAKPYLDQLVKTLKDNTNLRVEIQSHCDSRGGNYFNIQLSEKRANTVVDYLISKGIQRKLVKSKGFGENKLLNHCKDGVVCSEEEHQVNRRTEFIVTEKLK